MGYKTKKPAVYHKLLKLTETLQSYSQNSPRTSWGVLSELYMSISIALKKMVKARSIGSDIEAMHILYETRPLISEIYSMLDMFSKIKGITINQLGDLSCRLDSIETDLDKWYLHFEDKLKLRSTD